MATRQKLPSGYTRWMVLQIGASSWTVFIIDREKCDDDTSVILDGLEGVCLFEPGIIMIDAALAFERMCETLVHEVSHAFLWTSGAGKALKQLLRIDGEDAWTQAEENIVDLMSCNFLDTFKRNGLLKIPHPSKPLKK